MKKIYSFLVAAMFATASFAQTEQATVSSVSADPATTVEDGKYYVMYKSGAGNGGPKYLSNVFAGGGIWASAEHDNSLKYVWKAVKTDEKVSFRNVATGGYIASLMTATGSGDGGVLLKTVANVDNAAKLTIVDRGSSTFNFAENKPDDSTLPHATYYLDCNIGSATVWYTEGGNADYQLFEVTLSGEVQTVNVTVNETYKATEVITENGTSPYAVGHVITLPEGTAPVGLVRNMLFNNAVVEGDAHTVAAEGTLLFNYAQDFSALPFTVSASFDDLKWHNITIRNSKVWTMEGDVAKAVEGGDKSADETHWAIVASDNLVTKGWYVVNKTQPTKVLTLSLNANGGVDEATTAILVDRESADAKQWSIQASGDKYVFRLLNDVTLNAYLNDHGQSGILKTWVSAGAATDVGSQVVFEVVESASVKSAKVADESEVVYYDLNGRKVSKLVSGKVYITNKGVKVLVK